MWERKPVPGTYPNDMRSKRQPAPHNVLYDTFFLLTFK
jgi:hypothetical protein